MSWLSVECVRAMVERARKRDSRQAGFYRDLAVAAIIGAAADGQELGEQAKLVQELMGEGQAV